MDGPLDPEEVAEVNAIQLALRFGWTLDYVREMDTADFYRTLTVLGAIDAAQAYRQKGRR